MNGGRLGFGVALTSGASLALSLLFTRIFSVTMYYHFAFLLVSLALLGIAVSGVAVSVLPRVFTPERRPMLAGLSATLIGPLAALALAVAVKTPLSVHLGPDHTRRLLLLYATTALPFLASGFAITLAISSAGEWIGRVYAFDLCGAALGCVLMIPLIGAVGGPGAVLIAGAVAGLGGAALTGGRGRGVALFGILVALVLGVLAFGPVRNGTMFRFAKGTKFLDESAVELERWNAFSRVTVSRGEADHKWLHIDADAATRMYSGTLAKDNYAATQRFSEARVAGLVYALRREGPALIIGPGGGPDVISALRAGLPRVVGVEVNPLIAEDIMRGSHAGWNGDLYRDRRVDVHVDDGRSFVRRSNESYSSIQATLVDTWAASASGAFTLSENNLYTVEAFEDYLAHLAPDGVVSMTRWWGNPPIEFLRLAGLAREALVRRSVPETEHHRYFYVAADDRMATMLVKRQAFTDAELETLEQARIAAGLRLLYRRGGSSSDGWLERFLAEPAATFAARLPLDISPVTDDRPFFFYNERGAAFVTLLTRLPRLSRDNLGLAILQMVLLTSLLLTLVLVLVPLVLFQRRALSGEARGPKLRVLSYFLALGLGYILVELGLMQRFILFLGHPLYALSVVLATLLAASGVGSALSPRAERRFGRTGTVRWAVLALAGIGLAYLFGLGPLFDALLGLPLAARISTAVLLVAILGGLMGLLLPLGVRSAEELGVGMVPWAWGINGAASVVGSTLAMVLSMNLGFGATLLAGICAYGLGAVVLPRQGLART